MEVSDETEGDMLVLLGCRCRCGHEWLPREKGEKPLFPDARHRQRRARLPARLPGSTRASSQCLLLPERRRRRISPCFRCRPESAPFCPTWCGSRTTVERAAHLTADESALDGVGETVEMLAARVGVGAVSRPIVRETPYYRMIRLPFPAPAT
jgi:hypothetical protein